MKQFAELLRFVLKLILIGIVLVWTKKHFQILFWPFISIVTFVLAVFFVFAFGMLLDLVEVYDLEKTLSNEIFPPFCWSFYLVLYPFMYIAVQLLENNFTEEVSRFKTWYIITGFLYGSIITLLIYMRVTQNPYEYAYTSI